MNNELEVYGSHPDFLLPRCVTQSRTSRASGTNPWRLRTGHLQWQDSCRDLNSEYKQMFYYQHCSRKTLAHSRQISDMRPVTFLNLLRIAWVEHILSPSVSVCLSVAPFTRMGPEVPSLWKLLHKINMGSYSRKTCLRCDSDITLR